MYNRAKLIENNQRLDAKMVLKGSSGLARGDSLLIDGREFELAWEADPMLPGEHWRLRFVCPGCSCHTRYLYLPQLTCRKCSKFDYFSRRCVRTKGPIVRA